VNTGQYTITQEYRVNTIANKHQHPEINRRQYLIRICGANDAVRFDTPPAHLFLSHSQMLAYMS